MGLFAVFVLPHLLGWNIYAVASGSMEPAYPVGALVFTRAVPPGSIVPGECITYLSGKVTVTHRVVAVDLSGQRFFTKGDANRHLDAPVDFSRLIGKTESFCLPLLGYLVLGLKSRWGMGALALAGAGVVLAIGAGLIADSKKRRKEG